jgi:SAM-dependent methyltransferase
LSHHAFENAVQVGAVPFGIVKHVVDEAMRAYYDQRAPEYDDGWLGNGRHSGIARPGWHEEVGQLVGLIDGLPPARVLDVACGTGFLTRHLRGDVVALDQSKAMVESASARLPGVDVIHGEAVPLPFADGAFDCIFTSHFYGLLLHGERERFVAEARRVGRSLLVVDSALREGGVPESWEERILADGSRHRVHKRWFTSKGLAEELGGGEVLHDGDWFVVVDAGRCLTLQV